MKKYVIFEDDGYAFTELARKDTAEEALAFARSIVQVFREESRENINGHHFVFIRGGDSTLKFRGLWIRKAEV